MANGVAELDFLTASVKAIWYPEASVPQNGVVLAYALNITGPLEIVFEMEGRGLKRPKAWFSHGSIVEHAKSHAFKMKRDRWPFLIAENLFD
jgi:hypothetical protein